ncbi:hypothetical protein [Pararobbsia alpina]|uniref:Uncharacterized protein n=1 Tax=Pararobbsia alpina TaxID=621374 RepID=A0A6S7BL96_9BURK|nr:hypothetical protein [Pararobbsia alpina]CAB3804372.1 hypothetical protein LMG28138_05503 [Pararobbsia alpina]
MAKRVNFHCSICDAQTVGPKKDSDKSFSIGKAAHIKAAAPEGPRFDENQTPEERRSIRNGIWACANCADIIDRDETAYPVEELHRLKEKAERLAKVRAGRPPVSQKPLPWTRSEIRRAVDIYCLTEAERQERLDPRFSVDVHWSGNGPVYELEAREPVEARMIVRGSARQQTVAALNDVLDYGGSQSFEGKDIGLEGSPIFDTDTNGVITRLKITTHAKAITLTVALGEDPRCVFVEFTGEATQGQKGLRIKASAYDGLLSTELTHDRTTKARTFNLHFDIQQWAGKPLLSVPNFAKLMQVAQTLKAGTPVKLQLVSNGQEVELGTGTLDADDYHRYLRAFLRELTFLRKLDKFFRLNVTMPDDVHDVLHKAASGREILALMDIDKLVNQEFRGMVVPAEPLDNLLAAVSAQTPSLMVLKQKVDSIRIFDKTYGPFEVEFTSEHAVIAPVGPVNIEVGVPLEMSMRPVDGHHWAARNSPGT